MNMSLTTNDLHCNISLTKQHLTVTRAFSDELYYKTVSILGLAVTKVSTKSGVTLEHL